MPTSVPSLPPANKRRKTQNDTNIAKSVKSLEEELTNAISNNGSLNSLSDLLELAINARESQNTSKGIYALYRVFVLLIINNKLIITGDEAAKVVKAWLLEQIDTYVEFLGGLLQDEEKALRISALQILFSLQKHLSSAYSNVLTSSTPQPQFHMTHFRRIVSYLLLCPPSSRKKQKKRDGIIDPDVLNHFVETWFSVHDDIRWFFLRDAATLLNATPAQSHGNLPSNLLSVLELLTTFPTEPSELNAWWVPELGTKPPRPKHARKKIGNVDPLEDEEEGEMEEKEGIPDDDWRKFFDETPSADDSKKSATQPHARLHTLTIHQSLHSLPSHRAVFTRTWLSLLPRISIEGNNQELALRVLNVMHRGVMPHLTRAVLAMDWIASCVDYGGAVGLLALNALFILIRDYNLDYPLFYTRLYAFLDRDVLHLKFRARFFRMTEVFLSSTHLPATILASFVKKLARLSLSAPPAAIIMIIPFTYNILKQHPALMVMIHRNVEDDPSNDPFLSHEPNPLLTQALSSSLWELQTHRFHYHSGISTLVKILSEAFTKPHYNMEDFLDHTYHTLFETEANRKIKRQPALAIEIDQPISNLLGQKEMAEDEAGEDEDAENYHNNRDIIAQLWS
ncbi:hypothetical protein AMATHDRAFT_150792 [Amanita thiersii Skay4041]|uniref:CCAAT-binding factor domain-containing protein n=1 Tax=Amanita thiersii Skay4041 TaxID=703135 RepID=A0A2A9NJT5_9AGAR|nr:hypothetical protein AMATHDRAFT_150792 [Amanita thiersii Skay4041]